MTHIQHAMKALSLCPDISSINKTHLFFFFTQLFQELVMQPVVTANDYYQ